MKKLLVAAGMLLTLHLSAQNRLLNQPMQIKRVSIDVKTDCFTAVTFVEMEFYNPKDVEIEGLYHFNLEPGQVITAFQLDLHGQFRDGSIEEKWKAQNAYNSIVGKRIDPALLMKSHGESYSLNIYPIAPRSSRRITMTIHQVLKTHNNMLLYHFALNRRDTAAAFQLQIRTGDCGTPIIDKGMLEPLRFRYKGNHHSLFHASKNEGLGNPIRFMLPLPEQAYCMQTRDNQKFFALRIRHQFQKEVELSAEKIKVYWDVSASSEQTNKDRELIFLKDYIKRRNVEELTIVLFNEQVHQERKFSPGNDRSWIRYLENLSYDGATRFDQLSLDRDRYDAVFLFHRRENELWQKKRSTFRQSALCCHFFTPCRYILHQ